MPAALPSGGAIWRWIEGLQANEEAQRSRQRPAAAGCVPTPAAIARLMAQRLWRGRDTQRVVRVLDAGCGNATLLTATVRQAVRLGMHVDATGVDNDAEAVRWSAGLSHLMRQAAGRHLSRWSVQRADYLLHPPSGCFDLIVSNPPYVSLRSLSAAQRQDLRRVHTPGRGDLAMLFLQTMLDQLAPGGRLCAIVPNKLLAAHYAEPLRQRLLSDFQLREVHDLSGATPFPGIGAYPVILVVQRSKPRGAIKIFGAAQKPASLRARDVQQLPGSLLPLGLPPRLISMVNRLCAQATFRDHVPIQCGIATSGFGRAVGRGPQRIVLSGDVQPFGVRRRRAFDARRAGIPVARLLRQRVEKIVVPGMFQDLCAARSTRMDLLGRVYFIPLAARQPHSAEEHAALLLAVLNSRLFRVLYRGLFGAVSQAGGWLRLNGPYLAAMPWPTAAPTAELLELVRQAEAGAARVVHERLDELVEELFAVQTEEVELLREIDRARRWKVRNGGTRSSRQAAAGAPEVDRKDAVTNCQNVN